MNLNNFLTKLNLFISFYNRSHILKDDEDDVEALTNEEINEEVIVVNVEIVVNIVTGDK